MQRVRELLAGTADGEQAEAGEADSVTVAEIAIRPVVKRTLSPAGRKRIAEAQRRRWAKQKQVLVTKLPPKHAPVKRVRKTPPVATPTALPGGVPQGPVSAPAPQKELTAPL